MLRFIEEKKDVYKVEECSNYDKPYTFEGVPGYLISTLNRFPSNVTVEELIALLKNFNKKQEEDLVDIAYTYLNNSYVKNKFNEITYVYFTSIDKESETITADVYHIEREDFGCYQDIIFFNSLKSYLKEFVPISNVNYDTFYYISKQIKDLHSELILECSSIKEDDLTM